MHENNVFVRVVIYYNNNFTEKTFIFYQLLFNCDVKFTSNESSFFKTILYKCNYSN